MVEHLHMHKVLGSIPGIEGTEEAREMVVNRE